MDGTLKSGPDRPWLAGLPGSLLLALILGTGCAGTDRALEFVPPGAFRQRDLDRNGRISLEEYLSDRTEPQGKRAAARFERLDANHDGDLEPREFARSHWQWWLGAFSLVTFVVSLIAVPMIVVRLPADYFSHKHENAGWVRSPAVRIEWLILKNLCGFVLLLGGLAMLVLPGQGVLTILLALALLDLPGKKNLIAWVVRRHGVLASINWIRRRRGHPPMKEPPPLNA